MHGRNPYYTHYDRKQKPWQWHPWTALLWFGDVYCCPALLSVLHCNHAIMPSSILSWMCSRSVLHARSSSTVLLALSQRIMHVQPAICNAVLQCCTAMLYCCLPLLTRTTHEFLVFSSQVLHIITSSIICFIIIALVLSVSSHPRARSHAIHRLTLKLHPSPATILLHT